MFVVCFTFTQRLLIGDDRAFEKRDLNIRTNAQ